MQPMMQQHALPEELWERILLHTNSRCRARAACISRQLQALVTSTASRLWEDLVVFQRYSDDHLDISHSKRQSLLRAVQRQAHDIRKAWLQNPVISKEEGLMDWVQMTPMFLAALCSGAERLTYLRLDQGWGPYAGSSDIASIGLAAHLQYLTLTNLSIMPADLSRAISFLPQLQELHLTVSDIGLRPDEWEYQQQAGFTRAGYGSIVAAAAACCTSLRALTILIDNSDGSVPLPAGLSQLDKLTALVVCGCHERQGGPPPQPPPEIAALSALRTLLLCDGEDCWAGRSMPGGLAGMQHLACLAVDCLAPAQPSCGERHELLPHGLTKLVLLGPGVSALAPALERCMRGGRLRRLCHLLLSCRDCRLPLPLCAGSMAAAPALQNLQLPSNRLDLGEFPDSFSGLTALDLRATGQQRLPLGSLRKLASCELLDLSYNPALERLRPDEITCFGQLRRLVRLGLVVREERDGTERRRMQLEALEGMVPGNAENELEVEFRERLWKSDVNGELEHSMRITVADAQADALVPAQRPPHVEQCGPPHVEKCVGVLEFTVPSVD